LTPVSGRTHRENILSGSYKEIGTGVLTGVHHSGGHTYNSFGVTEDSPSATSGQGRAFLTGVAYRDANANHF